MFSNTLCLSTVLTATAFLSLAASSPAASDLPGTRAQVKLNKQQKCVTSFGAWDRPASDTCIPTRGLGYKSLEVIKPWPICSNGSEALFAAYDYFDGTCNPEGKVTVYLTQAEVLFQCMDVRGIGSFAFHCDGAKQLTPPKQEGPKEGGLIKYPTKKCDKTLGLEPEYHKADTCIAVGEGLGLSFTGPAVCANGTKALVAGFKGKDCDPTSKPLDEPFTEWDDRVIGYCVPTDEINSMTFWCDGLDGLDMRKPYKGPPLPKKKGSNMGMVLGLSLGLGIPLFLLVGLFVAYSINYQFREKMKGLFGSGDGYIAL